MARGTKHAPSCPICGKPAAAPYRPFCSKRCADVDLHRWMKGAYVIAGEAIDDETSPSPTGEMVREDAKH